VHALMSALAGGADDTIRTCGLHLRRVEPGSNVTFLHTGDVGNLFEVPGVVGDLSRV
jgi:hypothetical protein